MKHEKFRDLLEQNYQWPDYYEFKFIVKIADKNLILEKLTSFQIVVTPSKNGNYISISARKLMNSSDEVIQIYEVMSTVEGVISL